MAAKELTWNEVVSRLGLPQREGQIVRGVFEDQTEFAIALNLGISPHTVHTHFERLHQKLGVGDRVQLVLCVIEEFLLLQDLLYRGQSLSASQMTPPPIC